MMSARPQDFLSPAQPFFSIIVPTYNRPDQLAACLQALARLEYPRHRFEVIVADDESDTSPEMVVAAFREQFNVTLVSQSHAGPAAARNTGVARARGDFLAFTDDDCAPSPDWLKALAARLATTPDYIIGGRTVNALRDNPYSTTSQVIIDMVYEYYNADPDRARFFASNNLTVPTHRFRALGGFDATFTASEDRELCDRWLHEGYQMTYAPEAVVYHAHALTLRCFLRQHFGYGRGAFRFHQIRARRASGRFRQDLKFYRHLPGILRHVFSQARGGRALFVVALLGGWQVANAAGFVYEGVKHMMNREKHA